MGGKFQSAATAVCRLALATFLTATASEAYAQTVNLVGDRTYLIPKNSLVRDAVVRDIGVGGGYPVAQFNGEFAISGSYHYRKVHSIGEWELTFVPDRQFWEALPSWAAKDKEPIGELLFLNDAEFIAKVVGVQNVAAVKTGKRAFLRGRISMRVKDFSIGIDCSIPTHFIRFVRLEARATLAAADQPVRTGCV